MLRCDRLCGGRRAIRQKKETANRTRCPASGISAWTWLHPPDTSVSRLTFGFVFCYFRPSTKLSNSKWKLLEEICKFTLSTTLSCLKGLISAPSHADVNCPSVQCGCASTTIQSLSRGLGHQIHWKIFRFCVPLALAALPASFRKKQVSVSEMTLLVQSVGK